MAEVKDKIITTESLKALHDYNKETYLAKADCIDYVVERGIVQTTQNIANLKWEYEKWNSGKAICRCCISYQASGITLNGDYMKLPDGSVFCPPLPIAFTEEPYVCVSLQNARGRNHWVVGVDTSEHKIAGIKIAANDINDNSGSGICTGSLNIEVKGKWK